MISFLLGHQMHLLVHWLPYSVRSSPWRTWVIYISFLVLRYVKGLLLTLSKYVTDVLTHATMATCKSSLTLVRSGSCLSVHDGDHQSDPSAYRQIVGSLQYLTLTWLDVTYVVQHANQFMDCPTMSHWTTVKWILHYSKGTITIGLYIHKGSSFTLHGFSNANRASNPYDHRTVGWFAIFLGSNLISWSLRKQMDGCSLQHKIWIQESEEHDNWINLDPILIGGAWCCTLTLSNSLVW